MALLSPFGGMLYWHWLQCPSVRFVQHTTQSILKSVSLSDLKNINDLFFLDFWFGWILVGLLLLFENAWKPFVYKQRNVCHSE